MAIIVAPLGRGVILNGGSAMTASLSLAGKGCQRDEGAKQAGRRIASIWPFQVSSGAATSKGAPATPAHSSNHRRTTNRRRTLKTWTTHSDPNVLMANTFEIENRLKPGVLHP